MKKSLLLILTLAAMLNFTSCDYTSGTYTGGGGSSSGDYWDDSWDDDWYDDDYYDDDYNDDWDDSSDDDWGDDWGDDDGGWDDDDDGCWDCGDDWGWYEDGQKRDQTHSRDIMRDVSGKEKAKLIKASKFYANKFNLAADQSIKIAKTLNDFKALEKRTATDLAEFAKKLYGINTEEMITSLGSAQVGNYKKLDDVIKKAASSFNTTPDNMKTIIRQLHGKALSDNGINLK